MTPLFAAKANQNKVPQTGIGRRSALTYTSFLEDCSQAFCRAVAVFYFERGSHGAAVGDSAEEDHHTHIVFGTTVVLRQSLIAERGGERAFEARLQFDQAVAADLDAGSIEAGDAFASG